MDTFGHTNLTKWVGVAATSLLLALSTACTGSEADSADAAGSELSTTTTVEAEEKAAPGSVQLPQDLLDDETLRVEELDAADLPDLPDGIVFLDRPVDITAAPGLDLVRVATPVGDLDPDLVRLAHLDAFGRWEYRVPVVDGDNLVVEMNDFSPVAWVVDSVGDAAGTAWGGVSAGGEWVVRTATGGADWVADSFTGRSDVPNDCDLQGGDGSEWSDHTGSPGNAFAHVCMRNRDDGRVELVVRSNRPGPIEVILPDSQTPDWVWVEGQPDWATVIFASIASNPNSYILGPGRDMTIGYSRPLVQLPPQEIWIIQTGVAQALGEMAGLVDGWVPESIALNVMLCMNNTERDYGDRLLNCAQNGLPRDIEQMTVAELDSRVDDAYLDMANAIDADNLRWSRQSVEEFQQKFGSYRNQVLKSERWLARAKSFFKGLKASIVIVDTYTNIALNVWGNDEASLSSVFLTGLCAHGGPVAPVTVTGVVDSLNVRAHPGTNEEQIGELPAASTVEALLESVKTIQQQRSWVSVVLPDNSGCGWVAADYLKTGSGELLSQPYDPIASAEYVRRAILDLEPELLEATFMTETDDPADGYPFDSAWTRDGLDALKKLPDDTKIVGALPLELQSADSNPIPGSGCAFPSHGILCFYELYGADGVFIGRAETTRYGDGITGLMVELAN